MPAVGSAVQLDEICHCRDIITYHYADGGTEIIICNYRCYLRICHAGGRGELEGRTSVIEGGSNGILEWVRENT